MISKGHLGKVGMTCVDCGHPLEEVPRNPVLRNWIASISVMIFLLVLTGLPALLGPAVFGERGSSPLPEQAGAD
jgi:hypothetical protein